MAISNFSPCNIEISLKLDKDHIFCKIQAPVTKTGRSYEILKEDRILIDNQYSKLQKI